MLSPADAVPGNRVSLPCHVVWTVDMVPAAERPRGGSLPALVILLLVLGVLTGTGTAASAAPSAAGAGPVAARC